MASRTTYAVLSPNLTDFVVPGAANAKGPANAATASSPPLDDIGEGEEDVHPKWRVMLVAANGFVKNNVGLLLVASAQAFFSFMGVAVKILHGIDPPVSTFQVCSNATNSQKFRINLSLS
jgi:hypothetical protein